jgi:hypothetical protein
VLIKWRRRQVAEIPIIAEFAHEFAATLLTHIDPPSCVFDALPPTDHRGASVAAGFDEPPRFIPKSRSLIFAMRPAG